MNVTRKLSFMQDETKVLGSGDWYVDNDEVGSFCYSGIWQGGKVIALVLDEHSDSEVVKERGNLFVEAVNSHISWAKWIAKRGSDLPDHACSECLPHSDMLVAGFQCVYHEALAALAAAGEPV